MLHHKGTGAMKLRYFYCLSLLIANPSSAKTVYKTVQNDGSIIYSDIPREGSTPVQFETINSAIIPAMSNPKLMNLKEQLKKTPQYEIRIFSPSEQQTLRNNAGDVQVNFEIRPDYTGKFILLLDNQEVKTEGRTQLTLHNIERGEHMIEVKLLDNTGKIFASSNKQTFYLHKASALINAN